MNHDDHFIFTVAIGRKHEAHARNLVASAARHGLVVRVLDGRVMPHENPKCMKWDGIIRAPAGTMHITYLDADTLILGDFGRPTGAVLETWKKSDSRITGGEKEAMAYRGMVLRHYPGIIGSELERLRWNSGFISGPTHLMRELASQWALAWERVERATGRIHRDQSSFRLAYWLMHDRGQLPRSLDRRYNWIIKRWGWTRDALVLHKAGDPLRKTLRSRWAALAEELCHENPAA